MASGLLVLTHWVQTGSNAPNLVGFHQSISTDGERVFLFLSLA